MSRFFTEPIIISRQQSAEFLDSLANPNRDYIHYRDALFAEMDNAIDIRKKGVDIEVDIPDLDLSFIDEMDNEKDSDGWMVSVRLEETDWYPFEFCDFMAMDLLVNTNLNENYVMQETKDCDQLQIAA